MQYKYLLCFINMHTLFKNRFLFDPSTSLDFLATFPYYLVRYHEIKGYDALRLLRFFRVFQLWRLQQYDIYLTTMGRVLLGSFKTIPFFIMTLLFLAAVFGTLIYWFEKGEYTKIIECCFVINDLTTSYSYFHVHVGI